MDATDYASFLSDAPEDVAMAHMPECRKPADIKRQMNLVTDPMQILELELEHAESALNHFCYEHMSTYRGAEYLEKYVLPKRELDQKRVKALHALRSAKEATKEV